MNYLLLPEQANLIKTKLQPLIEKHNFDILCLDNPPTNTWIKAGTGLFSYSLWDILVFTDTIKDKLVSDITNLKNQFGKIGVCYALDPIDFSGYEFKFECYRELTQKDRFTVDKESIKKKIHPSK